jgi:hypothetical protein
MNKSFKQLCSKAFISCPQKKKINQKNFFLQMLLALAQLYAEKANTEQAPQEFLQYEVEIKNLKSLLSIYFLPNLVENSTIMSSRGCATNNANQGGIELVTV